MIDGESQTSLLGPSGGEGVWQAKDHAQHKNQQDGV
jgi:hypothetical protein